nr:MAG TPA: hypothetical protein [Caudoviricetes sp.]
MVNKQYFLLVFEKGYTIPTIISADVIANIFSCADKKIVDITTKDSDIVGFENVESFKMAPAEEINFNM